MKCPACGAAISAFDTWCPSCGATVGSVTATTPDRETATPAPVAAAAPSREPPVAAVPEVDASTGAPVPATLVVAPAEAELVNPSVSAIQWPVELTVEPTAAAPVAAPVAPSPPARGGKGAVVAGIGIIAAVVVATLFYFTEQRAILTRVAAGNLVTPAGDSAYDKWRSWIAGRPSASDQAQVAVAAAPPLRARGEAILDDLKSNNRESEAGWAEAAAIYEWLAALEPDRNHRAALHFSVARLHFSKGEHAAALREYYAAVEGAPNWALALNGLARTLARMGDRSAAQQFYVRATQAEPNWIFPWLNLAAASLDIKDTVVAEQAALRALALDPGRASAQFFLARVYDDTRRYCEAVTAYKAAIERAYQSDDPGFSIDSARRRVERLSTRNGCQ